jgi:hypothetical protein
MSGSTTDWSALMTAVQLEAKRFGYDGEPPCPEPEILGLSERVSRELGAELPPEYRLLLSRANGLEWNGLRFFGSVRAPMTGRPRLMREGIIEANLDYRAGGLIDELCDYLILGENDMDFFALSVPTGEYRVLTKSGLSLIETYGDCGSMFAHAMSKSLQ